MEQTKAKLLDWTIAARMRGIIRSERLLVTEWRVINVLKTCTKYFTLQRKEESDKMWQFVKGVGSDDQA